METWESNWKHLKRNTNPINLAGDVTGKEFMERVEKVFQYGGMMDVEVVKLYGKR